MTIRNYCQLLTDPVQKRACLSHYFPMAIFLCVCFLVGSPYVINFKKIRSEYGIGRLMLNRNSSFCEKHGKPSGSEALPQGIISKTSNLEMQPMEYSLSSSSGKMTALINGKMTNERFELMSWGGPTNYKEAALLTDYEVFSKDHDVEALGPADLEAYIEQLKKDLKSAEEENVKIYGEIDTLQAKVLSDSTNLGGDIDALSTLLDFIDSKGVLSPQGIMETEGPISRASENYEFKVLELSQKIEESRSTLSTLEGLHNVLKRLETICSLEDLFCGVKCIQFEDNCIRLSLMTPILSIDSSRLKKSLGCSSLLTGWDHELLIEVSDKMELKNIEIVPDDVHLDGIINAVKSSRFLPNHAMDNTLGWLVRQIQQRIILCNLRRLLVKNANNPRRSLVYSDTDETITSHLEGGLVASVKVCQGWPLSSNPLVVSSLKHSDSHSRSFPWSFLCEIQEQANSLDIHTRHELSSFVEAIELLVYAHSNASF